jgi:hypothetical protein
MSAAQVSGSFWLLADPLQEVLVDDRPAFCQLAPVPLRQLGTDTMTAGEPYLADSDDRPTDSDR